MTYKAVLSNQINKNTNTNNCEIIGIKEIYIRSENIDQALIIATKQLLDNRARIISISEMLGEIV